MAYPYQFSYLALMAEEIVPISSVRIQNLRCVYDATLELDWLTVLIGKNDAGKSSILDAIGLTAHAMRGQLSPNARTVDHRRRDPADIPHPAEMVSHGTGEMRAVVSYEDGAKLGFRSVAVGSQPVHDPNELLMAEPGAALQDQNFQHIQRLKQSRRFMQRLDRVQEPYRLDPQHMRKPARVGSLKGQPLPFDGLGLIDVLMRMPHRTFGELLDEYARRVPEVEEVLRESYVVGPQVHEGMMEVRFALRGGDKISARQASDGAMLVLGFLAVIMDKNPPQLIMIEEPENGIHPGQLATLMSALNELSAVQHRVQVLLTTHSPYILDAVPAENVRVAVRTTNTGTQIHRFDELDEVKRKLGHGFSVGEAWANYDGDEDDKSISA